MTPREIALGAYNSARGMSTGRVLGGDMVQIRTERLKFLDTALATVSRAVGTERRFIGEPDDATLGQMAVWLRQRRELLTHA